ncbi:MAG: PKD domain-containing protein [Bacteroidales bacterium]|nr:PKD domain-containing protein [Bacteroidales bacterium]
MPANILFTNQSAGGGTLSYLWDFGGGITSTSKNPSHTYTAFGTYDVKLTVSSDYGCNSTLSVPAVVIGQVKAAGTLKQGSKQLKIIILYAQVL